MTVQPADPSSNVPAARPERRQLKVRRAPKFIPFMLVGVVIAAIVAGILTSISPSREDFATTSVFGFIFVMLLLPGIGLGAVVALIIDLISVRRVQTAVVESVTEQVEPATIAAPQTATGETHSAEANIRPAEDTLHQAGDPNEPTRE